VKKNKRKAGPPVARQQVQESTSKAKVTPPRNLTPPLCERLRRDLLKACQDVAETHGLAVEGGELSDIDLRHGFNISFRVGIPMDDGAIYSLEKEMFKVFAPQFGLDPSDYGRTFKLRGDLHRIVAINPNRPKYPISTERVSDGRGFKMPAETIVMYLQNTDA
jgi:hypothetical protein